MNNSSANNLSTGMLAHATLLVLVIVLSGVSSTIHAATVDVGTHILLADTPGQEVQLLVSGGESVAGVDLFLQVGDGGPELVNVGLPAGTDAPEVDGVDLLNGTIFDGATATQTDLDRSGVVQVFFSDVAITQPAQTVSASGVLATVTIDTTGFSSGNYDLLLSGVLPALTGGPFDTTLLGTGGTSVPTTVNNGSLTVYSPNAADFDMDNDVGGFDFLIWQRGFGVGTTFAEGDADGDNDVDNADLSIWELLYGSQVAPLQVVSVVPETATSVLLLTGLLTLPAYRLGEREKRPRCQSGENGTR